MLDITASLPSDEAVSASAGPPGSASSGTNPGSVSALLAALSAGQAGKASRLPPGSGGFALALRATETPPLSGNSSAPVSRAKKSGASPAQAVPPRPAVSPPSSTSTGAPGLAEPAPPPADSAFAALGATPVAWQLSTSEPSTLRLLAGTSPAESASASGSSNVLQSNRQVLDVSTGSASVRAQSFQTPPGASLETQTLLQQASLATHWGQPRSDAAAPAGSTAAVGREGEAAGSNTRVGTGQSNAGQEGNVATSVPNLNALGLAAAAQPRAGRTLSTPVASALPASAGEKIAATAVDGKGRESSAAQDQNKNSLDATDKYDTKQLSALGTTGAEVTSAMPSHTSAHSVLSSAEAGAVVNSANLAPGGTSGGSSGSAPAATDIRQAVETIAQIADAQAARSSQSMNSVSFGLKFGTENLTVRVEMREGEVRTQFSSDSPELRAAIATQWSGLSDGSPDRNYHFSSPDFTTTDGRPSDAGADPGGSGQQTGGQFEANPGPQAKSAGIDPVAVEARAPGATAEIPPTAQYLRAIA